MKKKIEELERRIEKLEKDHITVIVQQPHPPIPYQQPYYPPNTNSYCNQCLGTCRGHLT